MIQKNELNINSLWVRYKNEKDLQIRNKLIIHYSALVNRVVNRIAVKYSGYIDIDDLMSYGIFGLIDAIEKYDINKGAKFETYASFRIRGEIIDRIREQDWIPRSLRAKVKGMEEAMKDLEMKSRGQSQVKDEDLAAHMKISMDELHNLMRQAHTFNILSLDGKVLDIVGDPTKFVNQERTPEEYAIEEELKTVLAKTIEELAENERKVIGLYYFEELTLKEIGAIIGVSESRISQLHSKALLKLKNKLSKIGLS